MSTITKEQLTTAFSGLSILTRDLVVDELQAALRDTNMEYHKSVAGSEECAKLSQESSALTFMIEAAKQATEEFDGIVSNQADHDLSDG